MMSGFRKLHDLRQSAIGPQMFRNATPA